MSRQNSALASLTANYTDSEDDDLSPEAPGGDNRTDPEDSQSDTLGSTRSNGSGTLVNYNLEQVEHDQIDDDAIGDTFDAPPPDDTETEDGEVDTDMSGHGSGIPSPAPEPVDPVDVDLMDTETVSSCEGDFEAGKTPPESKIPKEPPGKCSAELQEQFTKMIRSKQNGRLNMNEVIQTKKMFRNPSIYEKLISHLDIDEFGTNYPQSTYNPHEWPASSYYDELAKDQKVEMDRREKERRDRTKVEFVSGTVKKPTGSGPSVPSGQAQPQPQEGEAKRKSKWDQRGVMPPILMSMGAPTVQPVTLPASIVTSVAAAKAKTVINAFGTLPKKSK